MSIAKEQEMSVEEGQALRVLGEIHLANGETALAREALRQSLQLLVDAGSEYEIARTRLSLARLVAREGSTAKARTYLRRSIEVFRRLGAQIDLAQCSSLEAQLGRQRREAIAEFAEETGAEVIRGHCAIPATVEEGYQADQHTRTRANT